jgi:uncharacterized protein (TIGR02444 family)
MSNEGECAPMGSGREGENPLWRYAIDFYGKAEHEAILLRLQDEYGADVLQVITAIWLGCLGYRVQMKDILDGSRYEDFCGTIIVPLRQLRHRIKHSDVSSHTYELAKQLEISLEQEGILQIYRSVESSRFFLKQVVSNPDIEIIEHNLLHSMPNRMREGWVSLGQAAGPHGHNISREGATMSPDRIALLGLKSMCHSLAVSAAEAVVFPSDD